MTRRVDLAEFLRARRAAISPQQAGLVAGDRRRTPGLRREEVALLAGVSVSWYTWLEQGRPINVSADVLDALGRALRLDAVEQAYLAELAGHHRERSEVDPRPEVPAWAHHLLEALEPAPAYLLGPTWDYLAWNRPQAALFPPLATLPPADRNLVWAMFAVPETRQLLVDWESDARQVLSQFRAETSAIRDAAPVVALVTRLLAASDEFAAWWGQHDVAAFTSRRRRFHHPTQGDVSFEYQQLVVAGAPDLRLVVQLPLADGG